MEDRGDIAKQVLISFFTHSGVEQRIAEDSSQIMFRCSNEFNVSHAFEKLHKYGYSPNTIAVLLTDQDVQQAYGSVMSRGEADVQAIKERAQRVLDEYAKNAIQMDSGTAAKIAVTKGSQNRESF